jgi:flagellar biosynthesis anti-sigma factor FlgM
MKILPGTPQSTPTTETVESATEQLSSAAKRKDAAKAPRKGDRVDFSASLAAGLKAQQDGQARRVEEIKARIDAGTYRVSSREVAEKMLKSGSDF